LTKEFDRILNIIFEQEKEMKKCIIISLFICVNLCFAKEITLDEGLQLLVRNNMQLKSVESKLVQAKYKKFEVFSSWLPKLQLQGQFSQLSEPQIKVPPTMTNLFGSAFPPTLTSDKLYSTNFSISQLLFSSGKVSSAYKIASLNYESTKYEYEKTKEELEIQFKEIFLKTLLSKKILDVSNKAVEISSENYKVSQQLYREGRVSYLDFSSSQINYFNSEINLLKVRNAYEIAKESLKNILCVDFEVEPVGELEEIYKQQDFDLQQLKSNIPKIYDVKILDTQKEVLTKNLHITRTEVLPVVSLIGNYSWTIDDYKKPIEQWDDRYSWVVVLSWPIFSGGATVSKYLQNKETLKQINLTKESLISGSELQLNSLYSTYLQLKESLDLAKQNLSLAEENYKVAKNYYLEGRSSYLELLQAELNFSNTKVNYYQTLCDYMITCEKLKKYLK